MRKAMMAFLYLGVLLVAACSSVNSIPMGGSLNKTSTSARNEPNGLRIVLTDLIGNGGYDTVYATYIIHNAGEAQDLYKAAEALPPTRSYVSCPMDYGYRYYVTFLHDKVKVLQELVISPEGCRYVYFNPKDIRSALANHAFWVLFAHILGVPESQVHPTPTPVP